MSMFDYLKCEYPLGHAEAQEFAFQTKSLDNLMNTFRIDKEGSLWMEEYDVEDHSDPNAEGIARLAGSMARVNTREVPMADFTGEIEFHTDYGRQRSNGFGVGFISFSSYFIKGKLQSVTLVEDIVPDDIAAERAAKTIDEATPDVSGYRSRRI